MIFLRSAKNWLSFFLVKFNWLHLKRGIPILYYHRVAHEISPEDVHSILPSEFFRQMNWLNENGYKVIDLEKAVEYLKNGNITHEKVVVLTFDDGHKDNINYAYPILKKLKMCATIFVVTDYVGKKGWIDKDGMFCDFKPEGGQRWDLLSWEELISMSDVFKIEAHGKTHPRLTKLSRPQIEIEMLEPIKVISSKLSYNPNFFCFPYGNENEMISQIASSVGYMGACSTRKGLNYQFKTNLWCLKRNEVGRGISDTQFELLLSNEILIYEWISKLFNKKKEK